MVTFNLFLILFIKFIFWYAYYDLYKIKSYQNKNNKMNLKINQFIKNTKEEDFINNFCSFFKGDYDCFPLFNFKGT